MSFTLKALGGLVVEGPAGPLGGAAAQRRTLALLVILAMARQRGMSRERLVGLLWPDSSDERARHALAQTLYRLRHEFGDDAVDGGEPLRLSAAAFRFDVAEWEDCVARGELAQAAALYVGPFLDGFVLPGAPEFARWAEDERTRIASVHRGALERLAAAAARAGQHSDAVRHWRTLAQADPLDSRVAARLVDSLVASDDSHGALQYARVHTALVRAELDADPGAEFAVAVARARDGPSRAAEPTRPAEPTGPAIGASVRPPEVARAPARRPHRRTRYLSALSAGVVVLLSAAAYARSHAGQRQDPPLLAVGQIEDYTGADTGAVARILPEMLTANLSRVQGLVIISRTRLYELVVPRPGREPTGSDFARAAQEAGVDDLLDGALYRMADGSFRLDLRVIDVRSARVERVHQVESADAFALADSATMLLAAGYGLRPREALRVSDVSTSSVVAYGLYEEGMRTFWRLDWRAARRLFDAALEIDSTFAMAAFGAFRAHPDRPTLDRAVRLSARATDFERLTIRAHWARLVNHPSQVAIAETLAARYPAEPESHILLANALQMKGDFPGALVAARHAYAMDTASLVRGARHCSACEATSAMFAAYQFMDSTEATLRIAREWTARQPSSPTAWLLLREALVWRDSTGALEAHERMRGLGGMPDEELIWLAFLAMRWGNFDKAERLLTHALEFGSEGLRTDALWWLAISERQQGRLQSALARTLRMRAEHAERFPSQLEAQVLYEQGRAREAAAVFEQWVRGARLYAEPSDRARNVTWNLVHRASALAAAGDTAPLAAIADSMEVVGRGSGYGRDALLHHHVRGLLLAARGRREEAVAEYRRAVWSPVAGYTRTNFELARLLIELGRPHDAIPILESALHGALESTNMYVTHTELRALLVRAYSEIGVKDSVRAHSAWVERALRRADAPVRDRILDLARTKAVALR